MNWVAIRILAFVSLKIPSAPWVWYAAFPALIIETIFYLCSVTEFTRAALVRAFPSDARRAFVLLISALIPWLTLSISNGYVDFGRFLAVAGLAGAMCFWFILGRRFHIVFDVGFLALAAFPILAKAFPRLYVTPDPALHLDILGHLMWIRCALVTLLTIRRWDAGPISLWPTSREWRIGVLCFAAGIVPIAATAILGRDLHFVRPQLSWGLVATAAGVFVAGLWVVGLSEELYFRGVIERALLRYPATVAVGVSALVFGIAHFWFRPFPDYRRPLTATVLGIFCGVAYVRTKSIRSSMVTHALAIVTMRLFFKG